MKKLLTLSLVAIFCYPAISANYFVANNGNNDNDGAKSTPWETLFYATQQLSAGDTLFVLAGVYNEYCTITQQGTAEKPIVITSVKGQKEKTLIDGTGVKILLDGYEEEQGGLIQLIGAAHIHVKGLLLDNSTKEGIIAYECSNILLDNLVAKRSQSSGIAAWNSSYIKVKNCKVENACLDQLHEYITIGATSEFEVSDCVVENSSLGSVKEGIDAKDGSTNGVIFGNTVKNLKAPGIYLDAWTENTGHIKVFNNIIDNCNGIAMASEGGGLLHDVEIYNNISVNNINYGIVVGNWGDHAADNRPISKIKIYHNTLANNGIGAEWGGGLSLENQDLSNIAIENNIVANNGLFQIGNESNLSNSNISVQGNLVYGNTNNAVELNEAIYLNTDPLFDETEYFKLSGQSPAIDAAINSKLSLDFNNNLRPVDGDKNGSNLADIGAWEFMTGGTAYETESINDFKVFPNPFTTQIQLMGVTSKETVKVYSAEGLLVHEGTTNTISTIDWEKGVYIICISGLGKQKNSKIVIKN